uniref:Calcium-binding protein p22 n=1 Tax=Hydra vulgaris TaxID=6087 RepID=T2M767_HYDVU
MGSKCSLQLEESDIDEIQKETGFTANQIKRLYSRFCNLDKGNKAFLSRDDFKRIPELAINPLGERIIELFFGENHATEIGGEDGINFKAFMRALARFRSISSHNHNPLNTREHKLEYAFQMYDIHRTGGITKDNITHILKLMVGANKSSDQLTAIADRILQEAGNNDGVITFEEFSKIMLKTDFHTKMSIRFLAK